MNTGYPEEARRRWQATCPYRIIHSLYVEFVPLLPEPPESTTALVINVNRKGMAGGTKPRPPKVRCIDLGEGDKLLLNGRWRTIKAITVYRDGWLDEFMIGDRDDGYVYRPRSDSVADDGREKT